MFDVLRASRKRFAKEHPVIPNGRGDWLNTLFERRCRGVGGGGGRGRGELDWNRSAEISGRTSSGMTGEADIRGRTSRGVGEACKAIF